MATTGKTGLHYPSLSNLSKNWYGYPGEKSVPASTILSTRGKADYCSWLRFG